MTFDFVNQKPWNVPDSWEKKWCRKTLEAVLRPLNLIEGESFYLIDYYRKKIVVDLPSSLILCGYPKELMDEEGLDFFSRITEKDPIRTHRYKEFFNILFRYPEDLRKNVVVSYDVVVKDVNGIKYTLHHKRTPFQLDKNGNVWLFLCSCSISPTTKPNYQSMLINRETNEQFEFANGRFILSDKALTHDELSVLKWMVKDISIAQICELTKIPEYTLNRIKRRIFDKLEVSNSRSAIHKAHLMGLV